MELMASVIIESKIPYIKGVAEKVGDPIYADPADIDRELLLKTGAEALIVRTRTRCDAELLAGTNVRLVITATIGTDHIDMDYCRSCGIEVHNAPGCNAPAVAQYVLSSVIHTSGNPKGKTIGIIGCGHVGKIVSRWARCLGMNVLECDPPRAELEGAEGFHTLDEIAEMADIITVHTPLTKSGRHSTYHLIDEAFLNKCARKPVIINSARGPVTDTEALIKAIEQGRTTAAVIDCWEGEPAIDRRLLELATIATPHIAGYSSEGKQRATRMALEAYCRHYGKPLPEGTPAPAEAPDSVTPEMLTSSYDPTADTENLRSAPDKFEQLRNNYNYRHEPA